MSGDGGTGVPNGITSVISQSSRKPRVERWSCRSRAASLGAGGHLNGAPQTPTTAWPRVKAGTTSRRRAAPATE